MNYQRIYNQIVNNRKSNAVDGYTERHHIVPRSFGGTDDKENIVALTAREHFICHWLLIKIYPTGSDHHKAIQAFMMMSVSCKNHKRLTSRLFKQFKEEYSKIMSSLQTGENNSQYGTVWYHNIELKESKRFSKEEQILTGWIKGRKLVWNKKCSYCGSEMNNVRSKYCSVSCKKEKLKKDIKDPKGLNVCVDGVAFNSITEAAHKYNIGNETARLRFHSKTFPGWTINRV